jgi:hypothetical protein
MSMTAETAEADVQGVHLPDLDEAPLDAEITVDGTEYARIMRRIGVPDDGTDTRVCAFNSSI